MNKKKEPVPPPPQDPDTLCYCEEVFINQRRLPRPKWHDCLYIYTRNLHLLRICALADSIISTMPSSTPEEQDAKRNARAKVISREMDKVGFLILKELNNATNS